MPLLHPRPPDLVPAFQARAIESLASLYPFERTDADVITPANIQKFAQTLLESVGTQQDRTPYFRALIAYASPLETIDSEKWNQAQERIWIDLYVLHKLLLQAQGDDAYRGELTREQFMQTKGAILRILDEVRLYQFLKSNPEYQDAKFISFSAALNETDKKPAARIDPSVRLLQLAPRAREIQSRQDSSIDLKGTRVSIEHIGGGRTGGRNDQFSSSNIIDANHNSFWAEMILADSPIVQEYEASGDAGLGGSFTSRGAICHIYLEMTKVVSANVIRMLPFGEFPVRVIDLAYKEAEGQTQWISLPGFRVEPATLDWIEVTFEPKPIAMLRITLEQINYRSNLYNLPERVVRNGLLWETIARSRRSEVLTDISLSDQDQDLIQVNPQEIARLQAMDDFRELLDETSLQVGREREFDVAKRIVDAATRAVTKVSPKDADHVTTVVEGKSTDAKAKTIKIRTFEYVYGLRTVELHLNLYQPLGHYSSQKFSTPASILEVGLTTEEAHPEFNDGLGTFKKTSIEWDVEVGRDRQYPIAPKNWIVGGAVIVPDEYLQFDRLSRQAVTRLPVATLQGTLRKNGARVPMVAFSMERYSTGNSSEGETLPAGGLTNPIYMMGFAASPSEQDRMLITITDPDKFDANAIYTLRYTAKDDAVLIDIDEDLNSVELSEPQIFQRTTRDGQVALNAFPFVDYEIIHSARWTKIVDEAAWKFTPIDANYNAGTVTVTNGSAIVTGSGTAWLGLNSQPKVFQREGETGVRRVKNVISNTSLELEKIYTGTTESGLEYSVGEYFESDGRLYAFSRIIYKPVRVLVNDVEAKNLTDYESFEHEAFTDVPRTGRQIQFIHAGSILYFNKPIDLGSKIEVNYSWLTEYIKVNAVLRCNIPVRTLITPTVNSSRIELKTSKL